MFDLSIKDYTISAGGRIKLQIPSDFFQIMEATDAVNVDFYKEHARIGYAEGVGQGFRLGPVGESFHGIEIYSATAQTLKLCFSRGKTPVDLSQVVSVTGTVSVLSGELLRVLDNKAFGASTGVTAAAGNYSVAQLFNPAASGKNVVVTKANVSVTVAPTLVFVTAADAAVGTVNYTGVSKLIGGAGSLTECRYLSTATANSVTAIMIEEIATASDSRTFNFLEPIVVPPGKGVNLYLGSVNVGMAAGFQWYEEAV